MFVVAIQLLSVQGIFCKTLMVKGFMITWRKIIVSVKIVMTESQVVMFFSGQTLGCILAVFAI